MAKVRYAVVGLGHIAQKAVLPAFAHARGHSRLAALISGDPTKLRLLGRQYGIGELYSYDRFDECMRSGDIDALYVALPHHLHADFTIRAARRGIHVLCEKPMAVTEKDCLAMIRAAEKSGARLMVAYRLHLERANRSTIELVRSGKIGEPRLFSSVFSMNVAAGDIRLQQRPGAGPLYDIGIYCINAARNLFGEEPVEVTGIRGRGDASRFADVDEMFSATLRFPGERLASLVCSFGASTCGEFQIVGTRGSIRLDPAYGYGLDLNQAVTIGSRRKDRLFAKHDQFAAELTYFSSCIQRGIDPEPSGWEGLADVRVIEALERSAKKSKPVSLAPFEKPGR